MVFLEVENMQTQLLFVSNIKDLSTNSVLELVEMTTYNRLWLHKGLYKQSEWAQSVLLEI